MDAFEQIVGTLLQRRGYWTMTSVKIDLTKEEKRSIGRPTSPRWEIDIVGYHGKDNSLIVVECKSFLDSAGVECAVFDGSKSSGQERYKLFFDDKLRDTVFSRLIEQMKRRGFCADNPSINLWLAAGNIYGDEEWLKTHFEGKGWHLLGPHEIQKDLKDLANEGYENSVVSVVTKILMREQKVRRLRPALEAEVYTVTD